MGKTIKDMPYEVRMCDHYGIKTPKNYRNSDYIKYSTDPVDWAYEWELEAGISDDDSMKFWNIYWFSESIVGRIAKEENRKYRQRCKQKMRNGIYEFDKPRRNARWLAY